MKRLVIVAAAIVLALIVFLLGSRGIREAADQADDKVAQTPRSAPTGVMPDATEAAASSAALRQPQATPPGVFRPPLFNALPGGLNGRRLKDIYDDLAKRADGGDMNAALVLGNLVDECNKILYGLNLGRRGGSPDPAVQKFIEEQEKVAGEQCPALGEQALASAGAWLLRAGEGGNRAALLRLQFFPPKPIEKDVEAKKAQWRKVVTEGLARLAEGGDFDAMVNLGGFFLEEGGAESAQEAYRWFDLASRAAVPPSRVEFVMKMRDIAMKRAASTKNNGG